MACCKAMSCCLTSRSKSRKDFPPPHPAGAVPLQIVRDDAQLVSEESKGAFRLDVFHEAFSQMAALKCAGHVALTPSPMHDRSTYRRTGCLFLQHLPYQPFYFEVFQRFSVEPKKAHHSL